MSRRSTIILIAAILAAGCTRDSTDAPPTPIAVRGAKDDGNGNQWSLDALSFSPPTGWEIKQPLQNSVVTIFAPERPEWRQIGFRANIGVRKRPHPGVSLDRHRELLEALLSKSVEQVSATIAKYDKTDGGRSFPVDVLKEKGEFSIEDIEIDGVRSLSSTFSGVIDMPSGPVATKTYGLQILVADALYTVSLTFPREFDEEMMPVWESFIETVRVEQRGPSSD